LRGLFQTILFFSQKGKHWLILLLLVFACFGLQASKPFRLDSLSCQQVWIASQVLPGSGQVINKQYWKIPVFYSGMGSMLYMGLNARNEYKSRVNRYNESLFTPSDDEVMRMELVELRMKRDAFFVGAAAFYLASVADAIVVNAGDRHSPATATILSALLPGTGQVYNKKIWKVPVIYGGIASLYYIVDFNQRGYDFFKTAFQQLVDPNQVDVFEGRVSKEELLFRRDLYRRNRDLALIGLAGLYILNIIDANVDAHFFDWDISDNLAMGIEPLIQGGLSSQAFGSTPSFGLSIKFDF